MVVVKLLVCVCVCILSRLCSMQCHEVILNTKEEICASFILEETTSWNVESGWIKEAKLSY
jgi:hypothetical protein